MNRFYETDFAVANKLVRRTPSIGGGDDVEAKCG